MDAITLLEDDHKAVEKLFKQFEKLGHDGDPGKKRELVDQMIQELSVHAHIEEQYFYPAVREAVPDEEDLVLEGLEEHHVVKWTLSELEGMDPQAERFDAKVTVLMEGVRHHVEEEEGEMFPGVRKAMGLKKLQELGEKLLEAKSAAPTEPQPRAPDTPTGEAKTAASKA